VKPWCCTLSMSACGKQAKGSWQNALSMYQRRRAIIWAMTSILSKMTDVTG